MAGDHGVVAEGVSPYPQDVTWQMVANFSAGGAAINQIARSVGAAVEVYDVGVARDLSELRRRPPRQRRPRHREHGARSRDDARDVRASGARRGRSGARGGRAGRHAARHRRDGHRQHARPPPRLTAAFTGADVDLVVGRGTGLDDDGRRSQGAGRPHALSPSNDVARPRRARRARRGRRPRDRRARRRHHRRRRGGRRRRLGRLHLRRGDACGARAVPGRARLRACRRICRSSRDTGCSSTSSGSSPVFDLDMRLGEGTGAALAMGVIDAACAMMSGMATFAEAGVAGAGE